MVAHFATLTVVGATSLLVGILYGRSSIPPISRAFAAHSGVDNAENTDGEDESGHGVDCDLNAIKAGKFEPCKMVLCVRTDLKMSPGKVAAQCGHATLACYKSLSRVNPDLIRHWESTGQAKVALKCSSEEELMLLQAKAQSLNLCARVIEDAGRTEIDAGTLTVVGIGPGPVDLVNQVTGKLRLL